MHAAHGGQWKRGIRRSEEEKDDTEAAEAEAAAGAPLLCIAAGLMRRALSNFFTRMRACEGSGNGETPLGETLSTRVDRAGVRVGGRANGLATRAGWRFSTLLVAWTELCLLHRFLDI